jgi:hypothetical protein
MAQHAMPAVPDDARLPDPADPLDATPATSSSSRWAITRGTLFTLLAVFLPAVASLLAPVLTGDISYQVAAGQLMLERGAVVDTDPFTFTVAGQPWVNQQWGASIAFALVYDAAGWLGLLLMRALLIGLAFGLVFAACRAYGANRIVASLVTMIAFVVAATNLALRSQMFGVLSFAAVLAILAWRQRYPRLLWLIPLIMALWANTHGSFFMGWLAIGLAVLEDLVARRRLALVTTTVGVLSVVATLLHPWGLEMWRYVVELSSDPLIAALVTEWQAPTLRSPTGIFFFVSIALVVALLVARGRVLSWLQLAWLGGLVLLGLMAVRNVVWWAIGSAPYVALLVGGLGVRGRRLDDPALDAPRGVGYTAIAGAAVVLALVALPIWRPIDPVYGPEGVVRYAPRGVTEALAAEAVPGERLFAEQKWGSWFEQTLPGVPVMVDTRIELFDEQVWGDYLHVQSGRADWAEILDRWEVSLVAVVAGNEQLRPFLDADPRWQLRFADEEGAVYRRLTEE